MIDEREKYLIEVDMGHMLEEFKNGKPVAEPSRIPVIEDLHKWKKGMVNCWTGEPNSGKTTFLQFSAIVKSIIDNWKWCIWSPEMINSYKANGSVKVSASDIYDEIVHAYTGKSPYKHLVERGIKQMSMDEYKEALLWAMDHFYIINPADRTHTSLIETFKYFNGQFGFDGWIIDPFKNMVVDLPGRSDQVLERVFDEIKVCALETDSTVNIVTHPRSGTDNKDKDGKRKVVTQFDLSGGAAWNNSMDGIYSIYRPNVEQDPNDPLVSMYHLKQRKKLLVSKTGVYKHIEYDIMKNRYYFDGYCPIDGSYKKPKYPRDGHTMNGQPAIEFEPFNKGVDEVPF